MAMSSYCKQLIADWKFLNAKHTHTREKHMVGCVRMTYIKNSYVTCQRNLTKSFNRKKRCFLFLFAHALDDILLLLITLIYYFAPTWREGDFSFLITKHFLKHVWETMWHISFEVKVKTCSLCVVELEKRTRIHSIEGLQTCIRLGLKKKGGTWVHADI